MEDRRRGCINEAKILDGMSCRYLWKSVGYVQLCCPETVSYTHDGLWHLVAEVVGHVD